MDEIYPVVGGVEGGVGEIAVVREGYGWACEGEG